MAGIDKMIMNQEQYYKFCTWFFEHYKINTEGIEISEQMTFVNILENNKVVFNFSQKTDKYLMQNCKLDFVQKRLKEQYG